MKWSGISGCTHPACHHTHPGTLLNILYYHYVIVLWDLVMILHCPLPVTHWLTNGLRL